jgi:hypothetical protein
MLTSARVPTRNSGESGQSLDSGELPTVSSDGEEVDDVQSNEANLNV